MEIVGRWTLCLPLVAQEDTIRVEHGDDLEDDVLSQADCDAVRRDQEIYQTLEKVVMVT